MDVEQAIKLAVDYVKRLFGGSDHRLEEIALRDDGDFEVTVSYRTDDSPRPLSIGAETAIVSIYSGKKAAIGIHAHGTYKDVLVAKDGQVKAVRMRQIVVG